MSRKRGKQRKAQVEAVPAVLEDLAEGSGPVRRIDQDAITTVEDVVTTDDIATTEDVVTADDVVATPGSASAPEPEPDPGGPKRAGRRLRHPGRPGRPAEPESAPGDAPSGDGAADAASAPSAGDLDGDTPRRAGGSDASEGSEIDAADPDGADSAARAARASAPSTDIGHVSGHVFPPSRPPSRPPSGPPSRPPSRGEHEAAAVAVATLVPGHQAAAEAGVDRATDASRDGGDWLDGEAAGEELRTGAAEGAEDGPGDGDGDGDGDDEDDAAGVFPTSAATMDAVQLKHLVEALIFASDRPLTVQRLRQLTRVGDVRRLEQALSELAEDYGERGLVLQQVSGGYQFRTRTQFSPWVQQLIAGRPVRLSRAQLETLAIIAYRQPITRPEIDDIRGVDSTATLKLLIDRMLIRVLGKREEVGRPMLYGTTKEFLDFFSLGDLRELPTLREYSELTAESRKVMSDRLGIAPDGSDGSDGPAGGGDPDDGSGNGHGGNGHGGNGHGGHGHGGGHGGDDGGAGGPSSSGGGGGLSDDGAPASAAAPDEDAPGGTPPDEDAPGGTPPDEVAEALSVFWAASDAVDRSNTAALGESNDDAPADTWFDPSIGDSLGDLPDADSADEPGAAGTDSTIGRSNAGPRAAE